jgi:nitrogen fixation protein NifQ
MNGYTDTIRKYAMDDRFTGDLPDADGTGEVGLGAGEAGKRLAVRFMLKLAAGQIAAIRFQVFGCGFTIAACAAAAELAEGHLLDEVRECSPAMIDQRLGGLPNERSYCAELASEALRAAAASAMSDQQPVQTSLTPHDEHGPLLSRVDPVYRALVDSPTGFVVPPADRQLFAGLLALADREPVPLGAALNLSQPMLDTLLLTVFPQVTRSELFGDPQDKSARPPEINPDVEQLLSTFVPENTGCWERFCALVLARVIAARAAHPGHLWVAMGFFERPELSAAIRRHLPALAAANHQNMRWKRFLFKQVCVLNGGLMCKSPVCGDCSDYSICFAPEET